MRNIVLMISLLFLSVGQAFAGTIVDGIKEKLIEKAFSYQGQGDPSRDIQNELQVIVDELLKEAPQKPVRERLSLLYGSWKQVWGPYEYPSKKRGVDKSIKADEIYQTIFKGGYYYNTSPILTNKTEKIGLLRGEFQPFGGQDSNLLKVKFTSYPGLKSRPKSNALWELPKLAESKKLQNMIAIVPTLVVRFLFSGGFLNEVYTDADLRIAYGTDKNKNLKDTLYIMRRIKDKEL